MYFEMYSEREKAKTTAGQEDVFQYAVLPPSFRVQVVQLLLEAIGKSEGYYDSEANRTWTTIFDFFTKEKGVFFLTNQNENAQHQCCGYIMSANTIDVIDFIDLSLNFLSFMADRSQTHYASYGQSRDLGDIIQELNIRFKKHGIGYEFVDREIIRIDSKFIHAEVVRPAIQLLHDAASPFAGPLQEFLDAHKKYREGEYKDAVMGAAKSFESVLKSICASRRWQFDTHKDTASKLIKIVADNGLIPAYLQTQFSSLQGVLESGIATIRNKTSGHGQGPTPQSVPEHLVSYALHLTASNIVFLIESHKAMP